MPPNNSTQTVFCTNRTCRLNKKAAETIPRNLILLKKKKKILNIWSISISSLEFPEKIVAENVLKFVSSFDEWHAVRAQLFHVADAHINGKKEKNMARLLALIFVFKDLLHGLPLKLTYIILTWIVIMRSTNNREFHLAFGKIGLTMAFRRYTMQGREWKKNIFLICLTVHAGEWENLKKGKNHRSVTAKAITRLFACRHLWIYVSKLANGKKSGLIVRALNSNCSIRISRSLPFKTIQKFPL